MLVPYGVDNPMRRLPLANWALIAANVAIFHYEVPVRYFGFGGTIDVETYGIVPSRLQWFQPLTSAFLHDNILHLFGNMVFLWTFGNNVNDKLGHWRYLAAYLAFAVLSSLGHAALATWPVSTYPCFGASGAVFGVVGAYLTFHPINDVRVFYFIFFVMGTFRCSAYWIIGFFVAWDFYRAVSGTYGAVAVMGHLAGFAAGAALGLLLLRRNWVERDDYDLLSRLSGRRKAAPGASLLRPRAAQDGAVSEAERANRAAVAQARAALRSQVEGGQLESAGATYLEFLKAFPGEALDEQPHVEVANWLLRAGREADAAAAFHHFARTHPKHAQAPNALYSAGILYGQNLGQGARGSALLRETAPRLSDPAKARRALDVANALDAAAPALPIAPPRGATGQGS
ncbi:MAG: rhomboid family intramembrane serine protease [Planctomycetes bacterium]|nr:rhomboid family intramembrane serine protease [Planctomycetota bacterium]